MQVWDFRDKDNQNLFSKTVNIPKGKKRIVALGFFDGVHIGHQIILAEAVKIAKESGLLAMVHTFSSVPKLHKVSSEEKQGLLTSLEEKLSLFNALSVDETAIFPFAPDIAKLEPDVFLKHYVKDLLQAEWIITGEDYRFGLKRQGDVTSLKKWGSENQIGVTTVNAICQDDKEIASSWIRKLIHKGRVQEANELLGYPFFCSGVVIPGRQLGRQLGFPTANITIDSQKVKPPYGVYASVVSVNGAFLPAVTSFGLRPTIVEREKLPLIETMIFDLEIPLYGVEIKVFFLHFLRSEQRFKSLEDLRQQVEQDKLEARKFHQNYQPNYALWHQL